MKYLKINGDQIDYPYNLNNIRYDFPNTSFPENLEQTDLEDYDVFKVNEVIKPSHENYTKIVNESTPVLINGQYYQNWLVEDAPTEYTESMIQNDIDSKWNQIRTMRNQYLLECDWTQLPDSPLSEIKKQEWTTYRQSLRDITTQEDPFNIIWPTKPQ